MSKKFTKSLLSFSLMGGLLSVSVWANAAEYSYSALDIEGRHGITYTIVYNSDTDTAYVKWKNVPKDAVGISNGDIVKGLSKINKDGTVEVTTRDGTSTYRVYDRAFHDLMNSLIKQERENSLGLSIGSQTELVTETEIQNLFGRIAAISEMETNVGLDEYGRVAASAESIRERVSLQEYLAAEAANSTIGLDANGKLTLNETDIVTPLGINDGVVTVAKDVEKQKEQLVSVDSRVTKNTQAIQSNTRQLQEHNARLNSQQRQIRENHEEMKRAAAQSAALAALFQPYSVGKFNATAALGGYSDKQAVAVGVGYRFNEQTAAKAGVAASDGDVSYNVGVNFEF